MTGLFAISGNRTRLPGKLPVAFILTPGYS